MNKKKGSWYNNVSSLQNSYYKEMNRDRTNLHNGKSHTSTWDYKKNRWKTKDGKWTLYRTKGKVKCLSLYKRSPNLLFCLYRYMGTYVRMCVWMLAVYVLFSFKDQTKHVYQVAMGSSQHDCFLKSICGIIPLTMKLFFLPPSFFNT